MAHNYTPGLKVLKNTVIIRERRLPIKGKVTVRKGESVTARQVIAKTELPGVVYTLNAANLLGILPGDLPNVIQPRPGDPISSNQVIGVSKSFFGLFKTELKASVNGTLDSVSEVTGQVFQRGHPLPVTLPAYIDGEVVEILESEGAVIEARGTIVQGIFGLGGERYGRIRVVAEQPDQVITEKDIDDTMRDAVVVGGAMISLNGLRKAAACGVQGVVTGGYQNEDVRALLGYDIGVAITGGEQIETTLVITEGFGRIAMAGRTFEILKEQEGRFASITGATQIRAGVIRPEIIVSEEGTGTKAEPEEIPILEKGSIVRVVRAPYFGRIGRVVELPPELRELQTGAQVRVLEIVFEDGARKVIPRANVEIIKTN